MIPAKATILVVDDEPELLDIFATWLRRCGYHVHTAANGAEALKVLDVETVDVLVSDIRMPIMDGPTLVRRLEEMGVSIPSIIFVSGFGDIDPREMHALGVEAMIEKPLSRMSLLHALEESLMSRDELWLVLLPAPPQISASIDLASREQAMQRGEFEVGRGGCCFACRQPLAKGQMIDLSLRFADDTHQFRAQGQVRWYSREDALAGMAFRYLDTTSRDWVIDYIKTRKPRSYIPSGKSLARSNGENTATT